MGQKQNNYSTATKQNKTKQLHPHHTHLTTVTSCLFEILRIIMSLDNSNPTVYQTATGGGRKRLNLIERLYLPKKQGDDEEEPEMTLQDVLDRKVTTWSFSRENEEEKPRKDKPVDCIHTQEIYNLISTISDPEHPLSLGSLAVVKIEDIHLTPSSIDPTKRAIARVLVEITPTVEHCSLATIIGLGIRVRLEQSLPRNIRVDVRVKDGTHASGDQANKQLADKERVAAALENKTLMGVIRKMLETCE